MSESWDNPCIAIFHSYLSLWIWCGIFIVIDDNTWAIRYLIIDTKNWLPGKKVLISPQWIERVSWDLSTVFVNLSRNAIMQSPEYSTEALFNRDYETEMYKHYHRQGYWRDEIVTKKQPR